MLDPWQRHRLRRAWRWLLADRKNVNPAAAVALLVLAGGLHVFGPDPAELRAQNAAADAAVGELTAGPWFGLKDALRAWHDKAEAADDARQQAEMAERLKEGAIFNGMKPGEVGSAEWMAAEIARLRRKDRGE